MSEEEFLIQKSDDGEMSVSFSPAKPLLNADECDVKNKDYSTDVDEFAGNIQSDQKQDDNENLDHEPDNEKPDTGTENTPISSSEHSSNENLNFKKPSSTSTPRSASRTSVVSMGVSDKAPLLKNRSSTADSCIGMDAERDIDLNSEVSCECSIHFDRESNHSSIAAAPQSRESLMMPGMIRVPIVGHETMEARAKFTVFKIHVMVEDDDTGWFIFRRYSDFYYLNDQLKVLFPNFRLALPPKRWFRSSFDLDFLEERKLGLQAFVDNVTGHRDICNSKPVRDFFCFDDPPGPHDSLEESRAQCECMEEMVYLLRKELADKDTDLELLREELDLYKNQVQLLTNRLGELNRLNGLEKSGSEKSHTSAGDGKLDIDSVYRSGDILLTQKLDSITEMRNHQKNDETSTKAT